MGTGLLTFGLWYMIRSGTTLWPWLIIAALIAGAAKAWFVLRKTTRRISRRIEDRDGKCACGFFSWQTWLLVLLFFDAASQFGKEKNCTCVYTLNLVI